MEIEYGEEYYTFDDILSEYHDKIDKCFLENLEDYPGDGNAIATVITEVNMYRRDEEGNDFAFVMDLEDPKRRYILKEEG